jgi:hypothetical protein
VLFVITYGLHGTAGSYGAAHVLGVLQGQQRQHVGLLDALAAKHQQRVRTAACCASHVHHLPDLHDKKRRNKLQVEAIL